MTVDKIIKAKNDSMIPSTAKVEKKDPMALIRPVEFRFLRIQSPDFMLLAPEDVCRMPVASWPGLPSGTIQRNMIQNPMELVNRASH
jgi:hypothetical protein